MRTPADRAPEDGTPDPERTLGRDAEPLGLGDDRRFNFTATTPPADHPMRQPCDGTPMLGSRGELVCGRADEGVDGFNAVLPPGVSRLGRVREQIRPEVALSSVPTEADRRVIADLVRDDMRTFAALTGLDVSGWPTMK